MPNSFSGEASIYVTANGRAVFQGSCDQLRNEVVAVGRHETGRVGFVLDEAKIPGLSQMNDLCIFDHDTGLMIYRRNSPKAHLQKRVFRLETSIGAPNPYHQALSPHFAYGLSDIHLYGYETVGQLFNLNNYRSMYFEGRVHVKPHQRYLNEKLFSIISVAEPFLALAMLLSELSDSQKIALGELDDREYAALLPVAIYLDGVDLTRPEAVRRRLKSAPKDVLTGLESPLVGLLTGSTPGVGGMRSEIPLALSVLSQFDMSILQGWDDESHSELSQLLGLHSLSLAQLELPQQVHDLADALRDLSTLQVVLENDLIVYHCLEQSVRSVTFSEIKP